MDGKIWPKKRILRRVAFAVVVAPVLFPSLVGTAGAQIAEPVGSHVQAGATVVGGIGANLGWVDARTLYTREVQIVSDLEPIFRKSGEQGRVALLLGVGIRVFGFERLIGGAGYRGFDIDAGLRVGPGLSFSTRDTRIDRNRRFVLLFEPVARISRAVHPSRALYIEAGTTRPYLRFGMWQGL